MIDREKIGEIGMSLFFCGTYLSWQIQALGWLPNFLDIGLVLLCSLLFIYFGYNHFYSKKLNVIAAFVYLQLSFICFLSFICDDVKNLIWGLFGIALTFVFSRIKFEEIRFTKVSILFNISLCLIFISNTSSANLLDGELVRTSVSEDNAAFGLAAYCSLYALLFAIPFIRFNHDFCSKILAIILFFCCGYIVVISGVRSPLFGFFIISFYLIYTILKNSSILFKALFFIGIIIFLMLIESVSGTIGQLSSSAIDAISTIFGSDDYFVDSSALGRVIQRNHAIDLFSDNFFWGAGFKYFWVDFPLLQAFSDLGLFFGVVYLILNFILPIFFIVKYSEEKNRSTIFFSFLFVISVPRLFLHGQPYDWQHMVYLIPTLCFFSTIRLVQK